jgi:hypothetical protein
MNSSYFTDVTAALTSAMRFVWSFAYFRVRGAPLAFPDYSYPLRLQSISLNNLAVPSAYISILEIFASPKSYRQNFQGHQCRTNDSR